MLDKKEAHKLAADHGEAVGDYEELRVQIEAQEFALETRVAELTLEAAREGNNPTERKSLAIIKTARDEQAVALRDTLYLLKRNLATVKARERNLYYRIQFDLALIGCGEVDDS